MQTVQSPWVKHTFLDGKNRQPTVNQHFTIKVATVALGAIALIALAWKALNFVASFFSRPTLQGRVAPTHPQRPPSTPPIDSPPSSPPARTDRPQSPTSTPPQARSSPHSPFLPLPPPLPAARGRSPSATQEGEATPPSTQSSSEPGSGQYDYARLLGWVQRTARSPAVHPGAPPLTGRAGLHPADPSAPPALVLAPVAPAPAPQPPSHELAAPAPEMLSRVYFTGDRQPFYDRLSPTFSREEIDALINFVFALPNGDRLLTAIQQRIARVSRLNIMPLRDRPRTEKFQRLLSLIFPTGGDSIVLSTNSTSLQDLLFGLSRRFRLQPQRIHIPEAAAEPLLLTDIPTPAPQPPLRHRIGVVAPLARDLHPASPLTAPLHEQVQSPLTIMRADGRPRELGARLLAPVIEGVVQGRGSLLERIQLGVVAPLVRDLHPASPLTAPLHEQVQSLLTIMRADGRPRELGARLLDLVIHGIAQGRVSLLERIQLYSILESSHLEESRLGRAIRASVGPTPSGRSINSAYLISQLAKSLSDKDLALAYINPSRGLIAHLGRDYSSGRPGIVSRFEMEIIRRASTDENTEPFRTILDFIAPFALVQEMSEFSNRELAQAYADAKEASEARIGREAPDREYYIKRQMAAERELAKRINPERLTQTRCERLDIGILIELRGLHRDNAMIRTLVERACPDPEEFTPEELVLPAEEAITLDSLGGLSPAERLRYRREESLTAMGARIESAVHKPSTIRILLDTLETAGYADVHPLVSGALRVAGAVRSLPVVNRTVDAAAHVLGPALRARTTAVTALTEVTYQSASLTVSRALAHRHFLSLQKSVTRWMIHRMGASAQALHDPSRPYIHDSGVDADPVDSEDEEDDSIGGSAGTAQLFGAYFSSEERELLPIDTDQGQRIRDLGARLEKTLNRIRSSADLNRFRSFVIALELYENMLRQAQIALLGLLASDFGLTEKVTSSNTNDMISEINEAHRKLTRSEEAEGVSASMISRRSIYIVLYKAIHWLRERELLQFKLTPQLTPRPSRSSRRVSGGLWPRALEFGREAIRMTRRAISTVNSVDRLIVEQLLMPMTNKFAEISTKTLLSQCVVGPAFDWTTATAVQSAVAAATPFIPAMPAISAATHSSYTWLGGWLTPGSLAYMAVPPLADGIGAYVAYQDKRNRGKNLLTALKGYYPGLYERAVKLLETTAHVSRTDVENTLRALFGIACETYLQFARHHGVSTQPIEQILQSPRSIRSAMNNTIRSSTFFPLIESILNNLTPVSEGFGFAGTYLSSLLTSSPQASDEDAEEVLPPGFERPVPPTLELPEKPPEPDKKAYPEYKKPEPPEYPSRRELPPEPVMPEKPVRPVPPEEPKRPPYPEEIAERERIDREYDQKCHKHKLDMGYWRDHSLSDYHQELTQWECAKMVLRQEHKRECKQVEAIYAEECLGVDIAHAARVAETEREHARACAAIDERHAARYETILAPWRAECDRLRAEHAAATLEYEAATATFNEQLREKRISDLQEAMIKDARGRAFKDIQQGLRSHLRNYLSKKRVEEAESGLSERFQQCLRRLVTEESRAYAHALYSRLPHRRSEPSPLAERIGMAADWASNPARAPLSRAPDRIASLRPARLGRTASITETCGEEDCCSSEDEEESLTLAGAASAAADEDSSSSEDEEESLTLAGAASAAANALSDVAKRYIPKKPTIYGLTAAVVTLAGDLSRAGNNAHRFASGDIGRVIGRRRRRRDLRRPDRRRPDRRRRNLRLDPRRVESPQTPPEEQITPYEASAYNGLKRTMGHAPARYFEKEFTPRTRNIVDRSFKEILQTLRREHRRIGRETPALMVREDQKGIKAARAALNETACFAALVGVASLFV